MLKCRNRVKPIVSTEAEGYHRGMTKRYDSAVTADLRAAIEASDKSNRQIEREAGLAVGTVSRFARGARNITLGAAERTAEAVGYRLRLVGERKAKRKGG